MRFVPEDQEIKGKTEHSTVVGYGFSADVSLPRPWLEGQRTLVPAVVGGISGQAVLPLLLSPAF